MPRWRTTRSERSRNRHRKPLHMGNIRPMDPRLGLNLHRNHWPTAPALKAHEAAGFAWVQVHTPPWPMLCGRERTRLHARAPFDLVFANILAGPLCRLAPEIAAHHTPRGVAILSGLLARQAKGVGSVYRSWGYLPEEPVCIGEWVTLVLRRPG